MSLHWTLQLTILACCICAVGNAWAWKFSGRVRISGLLVCSFWALQQFHWWMTGGDSLALFIASDGMLLWYLLHRRGDWRDQMIATLVPVTAALYVTAYFDGQTATLWWLNWTAVFAQMMLGMPDYKFPSPLSEMRHGAG